MLKLTGHVKKIQNEIDEVSVQVDQAHILNSSMETKARNFDRLVKEWKAKVDELSKDHNIAQRECRIASDERFRVKNAYERSILRLDEVRKENKHFNSEIKDIMDQISEGGKSIHDTDKIRKRLEVGRLELQAALEESEGALEQEEDKVLRAQLELTQVRQEVEKRITEKDDQFMGTKKGFTKALEGMQGALETESKGKTEAFRMKKKLEANASELEIALEHANVANQDTQKNIKKHQQQTSEAQ